MPAAACPRGDGGGHDDDEVIPAAAGIQKPYVQSQIALTPPADQRPTPQNSNFPECISVYTHGCPITGTALNQTIEDWYSAEAPPILTFPHAGGKGTGVIVNHRVPMSCGSI